MPQVQLDHGVAAVIGAIVGLIGGFVVASMNYRQKGDELLFKAIDLLAGGSQKRNLGISAIELYWNKRRHKNVSVSLLSGSAIYLLRQSKQGSAAHELYNLDRIMRLLLSQTSVDETQKSHYKSVRDAVQASINAVPSRTASTRGLHVDKTKLEGWKQELDKLL